MEGYTGQVDKLSLITVIGATTFYLMTVGYRDIYCCSLFAVPTFLSKTTRPQMLLIVIFNPQGKSQISREELHAG